MAKQSGTQRQVAMCRRSTFSSWDSLTFSLCLYYRFLPVRFLIFLRLFFSLCLFILLRRFLTVLDRRAIRPNGLNAGRKLPNRLLLRATRLEPTVVEGSGAVGLPRVVRLRLKPPATPDRDGQKAAAHGLWTAPGTRPPAASP
jgi:hypothetical protein